MLKKTLAVLLVSGFVASPLYAFKPLQSLKSTFKPSQAATKNKAQLVKAKDFTDFSGTWEGQCSGDADGPDSVTISNDDEWISFDGMEFKIDGNLKSETNTDASETAIEHSSLFWNEDKSQLNANMTGVLAHHDGDYSISTSLIAMNLSLKDGKLVTTAAIKAFNGTEKLGQAKLTCVYERTN